MYKIVLEEMIVDVSGETKRPPSTAEQISRFINTSTVMGVTIADLAKKAKAMQVGSGYRVEIRSTRGNIVYFVDNSVLEGDISHAFAVHVRTGKGWMCCAISLEDTDETQLQYARCYTPLAVYNRGDIESGTPVSDLLHASKDIMYGGGLTVTASGVGALINIGGPVVTTTLGALSLGTVLSIVTAGAGAAVILGGALFYAGGKLYELIQKRSGVATVFLSGTASEILRNTIGYGVINGKQLIVYGVQRGLESEQGKLKLPRMPKKDEVFVLPSPRSESGWDALSAFSSESSASVLVSPPATIVIGKEKIPAELRCVAVVGFPVDRVKGKGIDEVEDGLLVEMFKASVAQQKLALEGG